MDGKVIEANGAQFLHTKYPDLAQSREAASATRAFQIKIGEYPPHKPANKIDIYLKRMEGFFTNPDKAKRDRGVGIIKAMMHDRFVVHPENVPESYFKLQQRIMRERGIGDVDITEEMRRQEVSTIIRDQTQSLDNWIDYLGSVDTPYPKWFKYYTMRNVVKLGAYDKLKKEFRNRTAGTTTIFPDINREALAYVFDGLNKSYGQHIKHEDLEFQKFLDQSNFARLYSYAIDNITPASQEQKRISDGEWTQYPRGGDAKALAKSLQGHGTGWCTAGEGVAEQQLAAGAFYVYYTADSDGKHVVPRIAIRMEGSQIAEVRGIEKEQNLEPIMADIAEEKMQSLPGADKFKKRSADMKRMTLIEAQVTAGADLDRDELRFLYELDTTIDGFGYKRDPRVAELRSKRDQDKDIPIIFDCTQDQVAHTREEIRSDTKVFVGTLTTEIFKVMPHGLEYIYNSFPDQRIHMEHVQIGGETKEDYEKLIKASSLKVASGARIMINDESFVPQSEPEEIVLVFLNYVEQQRSEHPLWIEKPTIDRVNAYGKSLGLELCPPEAALRLGLDNNKRIFDQKPELAELIRWGQETVGFAMQPIPGENGMPDVFTLAKAQDGLLLDDTWADKAKYAFSSGIFAYRLPK